jgi:hypothetical protein
MSNSNKRWPCLGDVPQAESMAKDLSKRFPLDTQVQSLWLAAIEA